MNYYLVIGHACDEESEWQFTNSDKELTNDFLEEKFTKNSLEELGYEPDEYEELKKFSRSGLSTGFLIREAIHDLLVKLRKN